ncbi:ankyrin repeat and LEM domain-containing protein 2-like [Asterias rubens]|uniref:ankyrin repeat and LEM domain-containing protein 2-like n=1 Tax=Asterias rubens TaxID=7604 RepID=UPI001454E4AE|nr:ankyrin repeat and LEM domain-containing protein 2-like [Asterias rubens]
MEEIKAQLSKLTVEELRSKLTACGQKPIPITKTTRKLVERRIASYLWEQQGGGEVEKGTQAGLSDAGSHVNSTDAGSGTSSNPTHTEQSRLTCRSQADVDAVCNEQNTPQKGIPVITNYFAVCIPSKIDTNSAGVDEQDSTNAVKTSDEILIYQDRKEALTVAKKNKGARFKVFKTKEEAETFAKSNQDLSTPKPPSEASSNQPFAEKAVGNFRSVKPQDLVVLRRVIEQSNETKFREIVWSNPRYLLNAGDTPTILQEGSRYNAMHIVAKENLAGMCGLILDTLENPEFILLMYPDDPVETLNNRREYLVDLYLNSPDKGVGETPLHFASKFGNVEVTELLVNHPQCDKSLKNKSGQTASQIVCSWSKASGDALTKQQETIKDLLSVHYYVPLFRSADNCTQPYIGEPWSPDLPEPLSSPLFDFRLTPDSPIDSVLSLHACAGPMSPSEAGCFRRNLHTPSSTERRRVGRIKRADEEKGLERIGRELAGKMKVSWSEYWNFLDEFVDITSTKGLQKLEEYLAGKWSSTGADNAGIRKEALEDKLDKSGVSIQTEDSSMTKLLGGLERLHIGSTNETGDGQESARGVSSGTGQRGSENKTSRDGENQTAQCTVRGLITLPDSDKNAMSGASGKGLIVEDDCEGNLRERTVKPADKLEVEIVPCQAGSDERKLTSTCLHRGESEVDRESPSDDDWSDRERNVEVVNTISTDETSAMSVDPSSESTDSNPTATSNESSGIGEHHGNTRGGEFDESSQAELSKSSSLTEASFMQVDERSPNSTEAPNEEVSLLDLRQASGSQGNIDGGSHRGNGDGRAEVFSTPKMIPSRRNAAGVRGARDGACFILGSKPTKTDLHVWRALAEVEIPDRYPWIRLWKQLVSSVPGETRDRWPTPARCFTSRVPFERPYQTSSPRRLHGINPIFSGSPLGLRARHFSEPTHRSREGGGLRLRQASFDVRESLGGLKAKLFQE